MSLMMHILADERLKNEEVFAALEECGMDTSTFELSKTGGVFGYFPLDDGYWAVISYQKNDEFYQRKEAKDFLKADLGIQWSVHSEIYFDFCMTERCNEILAHFVEVLAQKTKATFNYSFQRESTWAIKDDQGLRWLPASSI